MRTLPGWSVPAGIVALIGVDQATKHWVQQSMALAGTIPVIDGVFHLTYYANHGAVGGIGRHWPLTMPLLIAVGVVMTLLIAGAYVVAARRLTLSWRAQTAAVCALAPLLCTVLDRSRQGYVVDFLDVGVLPVFNLADLAANVGLALLALEVGPWLRGGGWRRARPVAVADPSLAQIRAELRRRLEAGPREPDQPTGRRPD